MTEKVKVLCPLRVLIVWHPDFVDGKRYADELYRTFSRDERDFCGQSVGIPIYYITSVANFDEVGEANATVIILFIDNKLILDNSSFKDYVNLLCGIPKENKSYIVYPISFVEVNSLSSMQNIKKNQCICLHNIGVFADNAFASKLKKLRLDLAHEFCRLLYGRERSGRANEGVNPSVNIFVSHAREDGRDLAKEISDYIQTQTGIKSFIDVNDIPCGSDFAKIIEGNVRGSILAVLLTDKYSTREWCQREILYAKQYSCPIIMIDALANGEIRRFPYSANIKTLHLGHSERLSEDRIRELIYEMLIETIKMKYNEQYLSYVLKLYSVPNCGIKILTNTPELYTLLVSTLDGDKVVLYPEPAINKVELEILNSSKPDCLFITPTKLPSIEYKAKDFLAGKNIGISISDINKNGNISRTNTHLSSFYVELCRYLLESGGNLCYAGNINYKNEINFVDLIDNLAANYCFDYNISKHIKLHFVKGELTEEQQVKTKDCFELVEIIPSMESDTDENSTYKNLTELRKVVIQANSAQIVIGGKTSDFIGRYPGILEEALLAIEKNIPLYVVGAYGGMAEWIASWLSGKETFHFSEKRVEETFREIGYENLKNGLSKEENIELAYCIDISRSIALILKGLMNLYKNEEQGCND